MAISAFVVKVPAAEALAGDLRRRFDATVALGVPAAPFIAMTMALVEAFPGFPPYGGEHEGIVPHLSVAHGDARHAEEAAAELHARLSASGHVRATCTQVTLIENTSGRWQDMHVFTLPAANR